MIEKSGSQYKLVSHTGRSLGSYGSKAGAEHRERQVQFFKNKEKFEEDHPGSKFPPSRRMKDYGK